MGPQPASNELIWTIGGAAIAVLAFLAIAIAYAKLLAG